MSSAIQEPTTGAQAPNRARSDGLSEPRGQLKRVGLRVTEPRLAVMSTLASYAHSGAEAVYQHVRSQLPGTSVQAVYNVLSDLTRAGLLRRIEPAGSVALYELRTDDNHHHLICTQCGHIRDVDCSAEPAPCLDPVQSHGFRVNEAEVTYWGVCPDCADAST